MGNLAEFENVDLTVEDASSGEYAPIPPADYVCQIRSAEIKHAKNTNDKYLNLCWEVLEGQYKGRWIWDNLNLWYGQGREVDDEEKADKTRKIAASQLKKIVVAAGLRTMPSDSAELCFIPMVCTVRINPVGRQPSNMMKNYAAIGEQVQSQPTTTVERAMPWT